MNNRASGIITLIFLVSLSFNSVAQDLKNWFNEDPEIHQYAGVSSDLVHEKVLKGKKSTPVIVAVLDGGTDINHPDLKDNIWVNEDEIPGNGIDDDNNGYIDDVNGWNFIGGKNGDVGPDNMEAVREYNRLKPMYEGKTTSGLTAAQKADYKIYKEAKEKIASELSSHLPNLEVYEKLKSIMDEIKLAVDDESDFTADDVMAIESSDSVFIEVKAAVAEAMNNEVTFDQIMSDILEGYKYFNSAVNYHYNVAFDPRHIVNDNYSDFSERYYGNNNVAGPDAEHGTHVAGIIGAVRDNGVGINGVSNNVRLMIVRVVPDGDERDKDVANAIRYAADNGAKIINMSFGKPFSPGKKYVDEAVRYAASKDVLLVHAAGNESANTDNINNFPSPYYSDTKTKEPAWIEVGAVNSGGHIADFSNYGRKRVDVFAPGASIYSTMPGGTYEFQDGTSMAAPVVSGIAAIIRSYYPHLTAVQVKQAIVNSVIKVPFKTYYPGTGKKVKFKKLAASGGIVNAIKAVAEAEKTK